MAENNKDKYDKVSQLRKEGKTVHEAAKIVGIHPSAYYSYLVRLKKAKELKGPLVKRKTRTKKAIFPPKPPVTGSHLVTFQLPETSSNDSVFIIAGSSEKIIAALSKVAEMLR